MPKLPEPRVDPKTARIRAQIRRRRETMQKNKDLSTAALWWPDRSSKTGQSEVVILNCIMTAWPCWFATPFGCKPPGKSRVLRSSEPSPRWLSVGIQRSPPCVSFASGMLTEITLKSVARDIPIHGGVNNWYIDVDEPPSRFRVLVGYAIPGGEFYTLCRSNVVETPSPGQCERLDETLARRRRGLRTHLFAERWVRIGQR